MGIRRKSSRTSIDGDGAKCYYLPILATVSKEESYKALDSVQKNKEFVERQIKKYEVHKWLILADY